MKVTPVAQRVAAAHGVDLARVTGTGPAGGSPRPTCSPPQNGDGAGRRAPAAGPADGTQTLLKGASAMLARYMDESRAIPTATSFRTFTVTTLDGRRKQLKAAGQKVSFTHLIAYAIARAATEQMPVMAHALRRDRRQAARDRRRRRSTSASPSTSRRRTAGAR